MLEMDRHIRCSKDQMFQSIVLSASFHKYAKVKGVQFKKLNTEVKSVQFKICRPGIQA